MKRILSIVVILVLSSCLALSACGKKSLSGVYDDGDCHGFCFNKDGTAIYYSGQHNNEEQDNITVKYWYGTYTVKDKAVEVDLSGMRAPHTGVVMSDEFIVVAGMELHLRTAPYSEEHDDGSWRELDIQIGLIKQ